MSWVRVPSSTQKCRAHEGAAFLGSEIIVVNCKGNNFSQGSMTTTHKDSYESPSTTVVEVKIESGILFESSDPTIG